MTKNSKIPALTFILAISILLTYSTSLLAQSSTASNLPIYSNANSMSPQASATTQPASTPTQNYYSLQPSPISPNATPVTTSPGLLNSLSPVSSASSSSLTSSTSASSGFGSTFSSPAGRLSYSDTSFNSAPISTSSYLWITADINAAFAAGNRPVTLQFINPTLTLSLSNGRRTIQETRAMPTSIITFDPNATQASSTYNSATNTWTETIKKGTRGTFLLDAFALKLDSSVLPSGYHITGAKVAGGFASTSLMSLTWDFGAAVYSSGFNTSVALNYNQLGVKPVDDSLASVFRNSDHAGTPENKKNFLLPGGTGNGGTNYTGNLSCPVCVTPCVIAETTMAPHH